MGADNGDAGVHLDHEPRDSTAGLDPKKRSLGAAERNETKRRIWHQVVRNLDPNRLVFIDESGANITLVPRYGRAPKGERCHGSQPRGTYRHLALFASLSLAASRLPDANGAAVDLVTAADAIGFFRGCSYLP